METKEPPLPWNFWLHLRTWRTFASTQNNRTNQPAPDPLLACPWNIVSRLQTTSFLLVLRVYFLPATEEELGLIYLRKVGTSRIRMPCSWWWTYEEVHLALK